MINPGKKTTGEQSAVEIPAKLLIANSSAAVGAGTPVVDVGKAINSMLGRMDDLEREVDDLKAENTALKLPNAVWPVWPWSRVITVTLQPCNRCDKPSIYRWKAQHCSI